MEILYPPPTILILKISSFLKIHNPNSSIDLTMTYNFNPSYTYPPTFTPNLDLYPSQTLRPTSTPNITPTSYPDISPKHPLTLSQ